MIDYGRGVKTYLRKLPDLLSDHVGEFALIHDDALDIFDSEREATKCGIQQYGDEKDFLVLKIEALPL
jgi:hypothetical protein